MTGIPRRTFLATTAALSATWGLSTDLLGPALAAPARPADVPTTLQQTILQKSTPVRGQYRTLVAAPGEPYQVRIDITGKEPDPARARRRRSLMYAAHLSDLHLIDAQSPARLEPLAEIAPVQMFASGRPHDTLTTHVLAQTLAAVSDAAVSPVTGAPVSIAFVTGDMADSHSSIELGWYIDLLDGKSVTPNSGAPGTYEGVQAWPEAPYAWHPNDPSTDWFGLYGYPRVPGLLEAAVSKPVTSVGLPVPWYAVYGNHDATFMGNLKIQSWVQQWALGDRKCATAAATVDSMMLDGWISSSSAWQRWMYHLRSGLELRQQIHQVTADPDRKLFDQTGFMTAHLAGSPKPGPIGHGFTPANVSSGETWWKADHPPLFRIFGLDTCNQVVGADGAVPQPQFDWLRSELAAAQAEGKLCVVMSHHNSYTLLNPAESVFGGPRLIHGEEFTSMLLEFPNLIAWVNGHTHINTIRPHLRPGGGGFWEITTASCIDFPQQQQMIEIVDNIDGTLSIFATVLDHKSSPDWREGDLSQEGLASLSRELAANDWDAEPAARRGSVLDRNVELLMPAPMDLSRISSAVLNLADSENRARLLSHQQVGARA